MLCGCPGDSGSFPSLPRAEAGAGRVRIRPDGQWAPALSPVHSAHARAHCPPRQGPVRAGPRLP